MNDAERPPEDQEPTRLDSGDLQDGTDDSLPGKRIGDFELLRELGRGGMGIVYEARQISLNRRVALKVLPPGLGLTETAVQRFEREARAAAKLHHTNIVPVHAIGKEEGCHYYAMELIEGQALSEVLRDLTGDSSNPLMDKTVTMLGGGEQTESKPDTSASQATSGITSLSDTSSGSRKWFDAVAKLVSEVADALHYAHGRGVIHRDIKPANLMLSREGKLCITDFGLARVAQEPGMTVSGSLLGTPAYMSPEQIAVGRVKLDHRTDIYSLGAVLYEMLAHRRPFPGDSREEILSGILTKDPRPPRRFNPRIPLDLETICQKAMEKDPDRRYQKAGEFANDLRQYLQGGLITARRAGLPRRTWKSIRRHPVTATVIVAVIMIALLGTFAQRVWVGRSEETAQRLISDARLALREGQYRDALALIDRAVAIAPPDNDARLVRAQALRLNWRMHEAADEAYLVLEDDPENWTAHAMLAALGNWSPGSGYGLPSIPIEEHRQVVEANAPETATAFYLRSLSAESDTERTALLDRALELDPADSVVLCERISTAKSLWDFDSALDIAERLVTARPRSAQGWRYKAEIFRQMGDMARARAAIARALELDDGDPWNYIQRSRILRDTSETDAVLADLDRAIELDTEHAFLYEQRAGRLNALGRFDEAAADAQRSIELNREDQRAYGQLVTAYLRLDRQDDARDVLEELRQEADTWANDRAKSAAYQRLAWNLRQLKNYDQALAAIDRAIELDPKPWDYVTRRYIHDDLGDHAAAEADCDAAARVEVPDEPQPLYDRGNGLSRHCTRPEAALADFTRAIELAPVWHRGYYGRGSAYINLERYEEALIDLTRAVELNPYDDSSWNSRLLVNWHLRRYDEGIADLERALELKPQEATYINNLGAIYAKRGRLQDAIEQFERGIEINPRNAFALSVIATYYLKTGRFEDAMEAARRSIDVDPDTRQGSAHDTLAAASLRLGRPDEARAAITAMLHRSAGWEKETASWANVRAASLYLHLDDRDAASETAGRAVEIDPENHGAWIMRAVVRHGLGDTAGWKADCKKGAAVELKTANEFLHRSAWLGPFCGLWKGSRLDADSVLALAPSDPTALRLRAEVSERLGNLDAARGDHDRALQADPRDRWALLGRARHLAMRADCEGAVPDLARATEAGAQDPRVWAGMAWTHTVLLATNCPDEYDGAEALDLARRALEVSPCVETLATDPEDDLQTEFPGVLGYALYREGYFAEAKDSFEKALSSRWVEDAADLFGLAMAQAKLGEMTSARETYRRAVARMQESSPAWPPYVQLRTEAAELLDIQP